MCRAEKWDLAEKMLERCIQFDIYDQRLYFELGRCREKLLQIDPAKDAYMSVLHLDRDHIEAAAALKRLSE